MPAAAPWVPSALTLGARPEVPSCGWSPGAVCPAEGSPRPGPGHGCRPAPARRSPTGSEMPTASRGSAARVPAGAQPGSWLPLHPRTGEFGALAGTGRLNPEQGGGTNPRWPRGALATPPGCRRAEHSPLRARLDPGSSGAAGASSSCGTQRAFPARWSSKRAHSRSLSS